MKKNIESLKLQADELNTQAAEYFANYMQELVYTDPDISKIEFSQGIFIVHGNDNNVLSYDQTIYRDLAFKLAEIENTFGHIDIKATERRYRDHNSVTNQEIKRVFVDREVMANVGAMVEFILNCETTRAPFTLDDIENFWQYPEYTHSGTGECFGGGIDKVLEEEKERVNDIVADLEDADPEDPKIDQYNDYLVELDRLEPEPAEIFEWWLVSGHLCDKLREKGECVIDSEGIWGRCTTGQAILLDSVISRICEDLEILEGQKNAWK